MRSCAAVQVPNTNPYHFFKRSTSKIARKAWTV